MSALAEIVLPRRHAFASPLELVGVPYVRGGVSPEVGFDCYTLMAYVRWHWYQRLTPLAAGIPARPLSTARACALGIHRALGGRERINSVWCACEPCEGCAVALGRSSFGRLHHCGVRVGEGVLHACDALGVTWMPNARVPELFARVECYECKA